MPAKLERQSSVRHCAIPGCEKAYYGRGYCIAHYTRWRRHGDALAGGATPGAALAFLEVAKAYTGDDCLIWPFSRNTDGRASIGNENRSSAARLVCQAVNGAPPTPNHDAAHSCGKGNDGCVTPHHLGWKTRKENEADKIIHGTATRGERSALAKITREQVLQIRALVGTVPQREIAARYGITQSNVSMIANDHSWIWLSCQP